MSKHERAENLQKPVCTLVSVLRGVEAVSFNGPKRALGGVLLCGIRIAIPQDHTLAQCTGHLVGVPSLRFSPDLMSVLAALCVL